MDRFNGVASKYLEHYLAWFRYLDSKEYENTASNKKHMLVNSCLLTVTDTNTRLRRTSFLTELTGFIRYLQRNVVINGMIDR